MMTTINGSPSKRKLALIDVVQYVVPGANNTKTHISVSKRTNSFVESSY
jgi:hypothetical protein